MLYMPQSDAVSSWIKSSKMEALLFTTVQFQFIGQCSKVSGKSHVTVTVAVNGRNARRLLPCHVRLMI